MNPKLILMFAFVAVTAGKPIVTINSVADYVQKMVAAKKGVVVLYVTSASQNSMKSEYTKLANDSDFQDAVFLVGNMEQLRSKIEMHGISNADKPTFVFSSGKEYMDQYVGMDIESVKSTLQLYIGPKWLK